MTEGARGAGGRTPRRSRVVLALGSNLGDRLSALQSAVDALAATGGLDVVTVSPVYETAPVGGPCQPSYLNAVLIAETSLPPRGILRRAQEAEAALHRTREVRWGPRTLDVDVIVYGDEVSADPELTLPHPRAHERAFVLAPWHDADPDAELACHGRVAGLLAGVGRHGVRRRDDVVLRCPAGSQGGGCAGQRRSRRTAEARDTMTPTRIPALALTAAVCAAATWLALRLVYTVLPPLPWASAFALLIAAAAEAWTGRELRARIEHRPGTQPVPPIYVARMVVLAKATSQTAALIGGIAAGFVVYLAALLPAPIPRHDAAVAATALGTSLLLAAAALYLEYCCRVPGGRPGPGGGRDVPPLRSVDRPS